VARQGLVAECPLKGLILENKGNGRIKEKHTRIREGKESQMVWRRRRREEEERIGGGGVKTSVDKKKKGGKAIAPSIGWFTTGNTGYGLVILAERLDLFSCRGVSQQCRRISRMGESILQYGYSN
jgi:hypothetical protein